MNNTGFVVRLLLFYLGVGGGGINKVRYSFHLILAKNMKVPYLLSFSLLIPSYCVGFMNEALL
jgi:hypothetical protein